MIIDQLEFADRYVGLHPSYGAAFRFLRDLDPESLENGRLEIDGEELFAIVERTDGKGPGANLLEHHRRYIDIQYVVDGEETLGWSPLSQCQSPAEPFDKARDVGFYKDEALSHIKIPAGCFAILLPEDAHAPLAGVGSVTKVVLKVAQTPSQILEDLRTELALSNHLDAEHDERLRASIAEIEQVISGPELAETDIAKRLRAFALELEVTHPRLTHTIGRVADALAQIGI